MIVPTVGRIVWYHPGQFDAIIVNEKEPLAALVAAVYKFTTVEGNDYFNLNLTVSDANGLQWNRRYVRLVQENEVPPPADSYCEWMPYQKSIAKGEIKPTLHAIPINPPIQEGIV